MNKVFLFLLLLSLSTIDCHSQENLSIDLDVIVKDAAINVFKYSADNHSHLEVQNNYYCMDSISYVNTLQVVEGLKKSLLYIKNDDVIESINSALLSEYRQREVLLNERINLYKDGYDRHKALFDDLSKTFDKLQDRGTKNWLKGFFSGVVIILPAGIIGGIIIANN